MARDSAGFYALYGFSPDLTESFALSNTGDLLNLTDASGNSIDFVEWENSTSGWNIAAVDSTIRRKNSLDTDTVEDWEDSDTLGDPGEGTYPDPDLTPPLVNIIAPVNDSTVNSTVTIEVNCSDNSEIALFTLYIDANEVNRKYNVENASTVAYEWDTTNYQDGNYSIIANAYDSEGNHGFDSVNVTVLNSPLDTTSPTINHPADLFFEDDSTGHTITWQPSDDHPHNYTIYHNGTIAQSGPWNGSAISIPVNNLAVGPHNYTLVVYDEAGHWASDTVIVTVIESGAPDTIPPTIDHPPNITYEVGLTGHFLTWQPSDAHPHNYTIYQNGTVTESDNWNGYSISINVDSLAVGTHNYTIVVFDEAGHRASDTVMVIVSAALTTTTIPSTDSQFSTLEESSTGISPGFEVGILLISGVALMVVRSYNRRRKKK